jgi:hypothetical protein
VEERAGEVEHHSFDHAAIIVPRAGPMLTRGDGRWSTGWVNTELRLVIRGHIDFGRVWSAACRR